jgi:hypothetical protein
MSTGRLAGKQNCCCSATMTTTEARLRRDSDINALFCIDIKLITASLARHLLLRHATADIFARARFLICGCFILCLWPAAASHLPHPHHPAPIHLTVSGNTNTMHNTFHCTLQLVQKMLATAVIGFFLTYVPCWLAWPSSKTGYAIG